MVYLFGEFALSLDKRGHLLVIHRLHEAGVNLLVLFKKRHGLGAPLLNHLLDGLGFVQLRFLFEIAYRVPG